MSKEIYDKFYQKYGVEIHNDPMRFIAIKNLCRGDVLDIGCGTGDLADYYQGNYTGIDISEVAIKMARKREIPNARFYEGDPTQPLNTETRKFDTIIMAEFLEHLKDEGELFNNIRKWIADDGRIIISVPNGDRVPDENHFREFTIPEMRKRFSSLGKIKFYNWDGAKHRILATIDLNKKNEDILSLVMIVKNEEKGLEKAILSAIEFTDNIVISVDKESEDKTLEIAKLYADTLKQHQWKDDFAAARNFAKEGVTSKWILSLDGHEYVEKAEGIEEKLKAEESCLMIQVKMENGDTFHTPRIFRSNIEWKHAIHNAIKCDSMAKYSEFIIRHDRTGGQNRQAIIKRKEQRDEMMPRLLKKELREDKKSLRALFYLARWYFTAGKMKKAVKYYKKYLRGGGPKGERWYCAFELAISQNALARPLRALKALEIAEKEVPNRWETSKLIGLTYMSFGRWRKAVNYLVDSFKINTGDFAFYPMERNDAETWDLIGFCFFQMKNYKQARIAWEESIKKDEDPERIKLNKRRIELIDKKQFF